MAPEKEVDSTVSSDKAEATTPVEPNGKADQAVDTDSLQEENVSGDAVEAQEGEQLNDQASAEASNEATDDNVVSIDGEIIQEKSEASAEELLAELAAAEARASENWDKFVRLQAEMENQRKRAQKEVASARKFALEGMVEALLPIRDSLELGLNAADSEDADVASIREGSELTLKMLAQAFEKFNIEELHWSWLPSRHSGQALPLASEALIKGKRQEGDLRCRSVEKFP